MPELLICVLDAPCVVPRGDAAADANSSRLDAHQARLRAIHR
jgi:hypothetical protein